MRGIILDARHRLANCQPLFPFRGPLGRPPAAGGGGRHRTVDRRHHRAAQQWNNAFYNALQDRNWDAFVYQLGYFCVLAAIFIVLAVYQLYLNQWLQIRWRRWLTQHYLDHWLADANHYRMQLLGDAADNPDQRIAEDISSSSNSTLTIGLQLAQLGGHARSRSWSSCGRCRRRRRCICSE